MNGGSNTALLAGFVRGAVAYATSLGGDATPTSVLQGLLAGNFTTSIKNGRMLVSSAEAGGSATWAIPAGIGPAEVTQYAAEGLALLENETDPDNPDVAAMFRRVSRLRVSFGRAMI